MPTLPTCPHPAEVRVRVISTSDVHGRFLPRTDRLEPSAPMQNGDTEGSLARVAHYAEQARATEGADHVILLDAGDLLQGTPTAYYANFIEPATTGSGNPQPLLAAQIMAAMGYDAAVVGNHDLETGPDVWHRWRQESVCPILGANVIDTSTQRPAFPPYALLERGGLHVAVIGLITDAVPCWLPQQLWEGLHFGNVVESAQHWLRHVHDTHHPDFTILLLHSGAEGGIDTAEHHENVALELARRTRGADLLLFGHDHQPCIRQVENADGQPIPCANCGSCAMTVVDATLVRRGTDKHVEVRLQDVCGEPDADLWQQFAERLARAQQYAATPLATATESLSTRQCYGGPSPVIDLIHRVQLEATGASISLAAPVSYDETFPPGPFRLHDLFRLYPYENFVCRMRLTGNELRRLLEASYDRWIRTMQQPGDDLLRTVDVQGDDSGKRYPAHYVYNLESAAGLDYEVDVRKPAGQRIRIHALSDGSSFSDYAEYAVAMNTFRAAGGGELLTQGAGLPHQQLSQRIEWTSQQDIHHLMADFLRRTAHIPLPRLSTWRFVPAAWAQPALQRDLLRLFPADAATDPSQRSHSN